MGLHTPIVSLDDLYHVRGIAAALMGADAVYRPLFARIEAEIRDMEQVRAAAVAAAQFPIRRLGRVRTK